MPRIVHGRKPCRHEKPANERLVEKGVDNLVTRL